MICAMIGNIKYYDFSAALTLISANELRQPTAQAIKGYSLIKFGKVLLIQGVYKFHLIQFAIIKDTCKLDKKISMMDSIGQYYGKY